MSGGSLEYLTYTIEWEIEDNMDDIKILLDEDEVRDIQRITDEVVRYYHHLEWFLSGDYSKEDYLEEKEKFLEYMKMIDKNGDE